MDCSHDELRVLDRIISRLAIGRADYGPLDLAKDQRDFSQEAADELNDCLFYLAARAVAESDRKREQLHADVAAELAAAESVLPIAKAPPRERQSEVLAALRELRDNARPLIIESDGSMFDARDWDTSDVDEHDITAEIEKR